MTWHAGAYALDTPTIFWLVDSPKAGFVLKHQTDLPAIGGIFVEKFQLLYL